MRWVEAAYRRGDLVAKRKALMDAWARYRISPPAVGVSRTPLHESQHRRSKEDSVASCASSSCCSN